MIIAGRLALPDTKTHMTRDVKKNKIFSSGSPTEKTAKENHGQSINGLTPTHTHTHIYNTSYT